MVCLNDVRRDLACGSHPGARGCPFTRWGPGGLAPLTVWTQPDVKMALRIAL